MVGANSKAYSLYGNFKNKILLPSIKELNEQTDIFIDYKEIKRGRKIARIEFTISLAPEKEIRIPRLESKSEPVEEVSEMDKLRARMNELAEGYQFDTAFFAQLHQGASLIWKDDTEKELEMLVRYVNEEKTVKNPLGFIRSKITSAWEIYKAGVQITFADLQPTEERLTGREEKLPEWFTSKDEPQEVAKPNSELIKEKDQVLAILAQKKEIKLKR